MCGIAGLIYFNKKNPDARSCIEEMVRCQKHRGPDGEGFYQDETVSLGHCRLKIIDLSDAGKQPMCNEDKTLWLTYNGEIYNYRELTKELTALGHGFQSHTDSEVILHAYEQWGPIAHRHAE
jgi:asparagine synthase (glutamine-hydrolysing)